MIHSRGGAPPCSSQSVYSYFTVSPRAHLFTGSQSGSAAHVPCPVQPAPSASPQTMGESANPTGHVKSTYQTASHVPVRLASTAGGAHSRDKRRRPLSAPGVAPAACPRIWVDRYRLPLKFVCVPLAPQRGGVRSPMSSQVATTIQKGVTKHKQSNLAREIE